MRKRRKLEALEAKQVDEDKNDMVDMLKDIMDSWDNSWAEDQKQQRANSRRPQATDDMAQRIMDVLCENGQGDFLLLRDDEIRAWWQAVTAERDRERKRLEASRRRDALRESGLSKLTAAERRALGLGG